MKSVVLFFPVFLSVTSAHFSVKYPPSRGDTEETQNQFPCGGLDASTTDRTPWPLTGGSLVLEPGHPWTRTSVNLGIGTGVNASTDFAINLIPEFNQTGEGMFCLREITIPGEVEIKEGMKASMQTVQVTDQGDALYNCADIIFTSDAILLQGGDCMNSTGVGGTLLTGGKASGKGGSMVKDAGEKLGTNSGAIVSLVAVIIVGRVLM